MSKADVHNLLARSRVGQAYDWAGVVGKPLSGTTDNDPETSDCSGFEIGHWLEAGVTFAGKSLAAYFGTSRPTAQTMYRKATKIARPTKYGDLFFRVGSDGRAYHVGHYAGEGWTLESGDGTSKVGKHTVEWQNARGVVWGRLPMDLGERTPDTGTPDVPDWPIMNYGTFSNRVRQIASLLNQIQTSGLPIGNWWGAQYYGYRMWQEVRRFRVTHGLPIGGGVDRACLVALARAL